ncbi:MAG: vitamin B12-dependent ribonucleotide reductase [archaeon]
MSLEKEMIIGLREPDLNANSIMVAERRYLKKDANGIIVEDPKGMFYRVAQNVALADILYKHDRKEVFDGVDYQDDHGATLLLQNTDKSSREKNFLKFISNLHLLESKSGEQLKKSITDFYDMMAGIYFLPNSPTLMNAGKDLQQLSACFTLPIYDSMDSIFATLADTASIHKSGGGTGFSFSNLRGKNAVVKSTGGVASGPISFMKVYDAATEAVKQGGTRRGANMGILRVDHPDVVDFIMCKEKDKQISNFNISVALTYDFMKKLEGSEDYNLIDPRTGDLTGKLNSKDVFDLIVKQAHKNGEPGIIFIDRVNDFNPTPKVGKIESTNPCGEQPLLPYESCNLGSINLGKFVKNGKIDYGKLEDIVQKSTHFLDNVIDMNQYPLPQIEKMTKANRKIGLGVMGFHDMLIKLGVPYNSESGVKIGEDVMGFITEAAKKESESLASKRGTFPNFEGSIYDGKRKLRNATLTTIAPTGTLSIIAGPCSSGIEPIFAISYYKQVMDKDKLVESNHLFEEIAKQKGFYSKELMEKIAEKGSLHDIAEIPEEIKKLFVTAHDIEVEYHIKMQAAFQKNTDNAISKTINFPNSASIEDVRKAYLLADKLGCKGVTVYRDGSRDEQVLNVGKGLEKKVEEALLTKIKPRPRPKKMQGITTKVKTGCGTVYMTENRDEKGLPFEFFTSMGKSGGCAASQLEAISRLVSLAYRSGIDPKEVRDQLIGIRCPSPTFGEGGKIFSCADAIAKNIDTGSNKDENFLESKIKPAMKHSHEDDNNENGNNNPGNVVGVCPDCHSPLQHEEGCVKCLVCGYSKC